MDIAKIIAATITALATIIAAWFAKRSAAGSLEAAKQAADAARDSADALKRSINNTASAIVYERLSQLNHYKIINPELWRALEREPQNDPNENLHRDNPAGVAHLIFATFKLYEEAHRLYIQQRLTEADFEPWKKRLFADMNRYSRYRKWWNAEMASDMRSAWDDGFVQLVSETKYTNDGT